MERYKYIYYDYLEDEIVLLNLPNETAFWHYGCGDNNLVYLGIL